MTGQKDRLRLDDDDDEEDEGGGGEGGGEEKERHVKPRDWIRSSRQWLLMKERSKDQALVHPNIKNLEEKVGTNKQRLRSSQWGGRETMMQERKGELQERQCHGAEA